MPGVLYYEETRPVAGTEVVIIVDGANKPSGIWEGKLIAVGDPNIRPLCRTCDAECRAAIIDAAAPVDFRGFEPKHDYRVYLKTSGTEYLQERLNNAHTEIHGLKRRIETERSVWHAALKAIVSPGALGQFQKIMEEFLSRLMR